MLGMETSCHNFSPIQPSDTVLDLRKLKMEPAEHLSPRSQQDIFVAYSSPHYCYHQQPLTSLLTRSATTDSDDSSDISVGSPLSSGIMSPTFAITQKVISAASPRSGKPTRPFKAYPKDPLALSTTVGATAAEAWLEQASNKAYKQFRDRMLGHVQAATHNPSPSYKTKYSSSPPACTSSGGENDDCKDAAYWERRRKNNEAAKRSRDARRAKEDEIAIRAAFLERENLNLKYEMAKLRNEAAKLRYMLFNSKS